MLRCGARVPALACAAPLLQLRWAAARASVRNITAAECSADGTPKILARMWRLVPDSEQEEYKQRSLQLRESGRNPTDRSRNVFVKHNYKAVRKEVARGEADETVACLKTSRALNDRWRCMSEEDREKATVGVDYSCFVKAHFRRVLDSHKRNGLTHQEAFKHTMQELPRLWREAAESR
eukprot:TRINITY_DN8222_c3_g1_i2.p1 TRINITY_DN8222_c3_g1~~TRINITY_DN8222_c3_g1_i2.p1  ORF type:complete len:179 (+),score=48.40 TRINITY_DN8222_c3_g1_i2:59-595(+)